MDLQNMNVLEQFVYYFKENGTYVFSQFLRHFFDFNLRCVVCCNHRDTNWSRNFQETWLG